MKNILFDLDGTINDSGPGIKRSAIKTLEKMNLPIIPYEKLNFFVGPPLRDCFRLCGVPEERIEEAARIYHDIYDDTGKYDCSPYPGIKDFLTDMNSKGFNLYICTSKGEPLAIDILHHLKLDIYFKKIYGASLDGTHALKADIIHQCLIENNIEKDAIMIGDTYLDIKGANKNSLPSIGVTWGYGDDDSMLKEGALKLVSTVDELEKTLLSL